MATFNASRAAASASLALGLLAASTVIAQPGGNTNAALSGDYASAASWDNGVPTGTSDAQISNGSVITSNGDNSAFRIILGQGAGAEGTLNITAGTLGTDRVVSLGGFGGNGDQPAPADGVGHLNISGTGALNVGLVGPGGVQDVIAGDQEMSRGEITIADSGQLTVAGSITLGLAPGTTGILTQTGGAASASTLRVGDRGVGTVDLASGTIDISGGLIVGGIDATTSGVITQSGGAVTVLGNAFIGNGNASSGSAALSGDAAFTIGGTLNLSGPIGAGGNATTDVSGSLSLVGPSVEVTAGSLNVGGPDNTSSLSWLISGGGLSDLSVTGAAAIDGVLLDVTEEAGNPLAPGTMFAVLDAASISGTYVDNSALYDFAILPGGTNGSVLVATRIPEPAAIMTLALACSMALARRHTARAS